MKRTALLLTLFAILATAPAHGASRLVVKGAGFGHGVGMSQYGAFGFAEKGADHGQILRHYYTGTQIGRLDGSGSQVRVLLKTATRIVFTNAASVAGERRLDRRKRYYATRGLSGAVTLRSASGRRLGSYSSPLTITGASGGIQINGRSGHAADDGRYRGNLQIRSSSLGGVSAINALALDDYIRGVVAGEMPSGWPQAALRAQAVAARTYALATSKNGDGFDQYADTRSQVYNGIAGETAPTDEAVAATAGEVVSFEGKPIVTYYFSTSGGRTEDVENVFLGAAPAPYLRSVEDPYDEVSPRHRWTRRMSLRSAQRRLGRLVKGQLRRIKVLRRGRSPRVVRAQIVGSRGRTKVSGPTLRTKLGLYDTWARFTVITASAKRGDGNAPKSPAAPTGGAAPQLARAASAGAGVATLTGRVDPATPRSFVTVQRRSGSRWVTRFEVPVGSSGRYAARLRLRGLFRVVYDGVAGPSVRVR
ncbi:MAG: SpoIID/LytB domain-containing protein [Thermoleophilia bacterium]